MMIRFLLVTAVCTAAFAETVTYNYMGAAFDRCNGVTFVNGNCPANFTSDYNIASFTFSAPLTGGLSAANELSSPNLTAWSIHDALGLASYASTDPNAGNELTSLLLSTDGSGSPTAWGIVGPTFAPGSGVRFFLMQNPTTIGGGTGLPLADAFDNTSNSGFSLGNSVPGSWTETLNNLPGGPTSAPVFLVGGSTIAQVTGTIEGAGAQEYYLFNWAGGAFSASASITGASNPATYSFTEGTAGSCSNGASELLNSGDSYSNTIGIGNLAAGQYCIGIVSNTTIDPSFAMTFNTPVSGVPEPSGLFSVALVLGMVAVFRPAKRS